MMRCLFVMTAVAATLGVMSGCADSPSPATPTQQSPPPATTSTPPPMMTTTTSVPAGVQTLRRATFTGANGYVTEGSARIQADNGEFSLELESDFRTSNSAALDVRLCTNEGCTGDHVSLGAPQRFSGAQSYPLANNGAAYDFVTIYCLAVRLPFGYGRLQ
jgi:hypothetical protein